MTKKEFIRECELRGYCRAELAKEYARRNKKVEYAEEDLRKCYEIDEKQWSYDLYYNYYRDDYDKSIN